VESPDVTGVLVSPAPDGPPERAASRRRHLRQAVVVVALAAVVAVVVWTTSPVSHPLAIGSATDQGTLVQPADWLRDGGESTLVGGRVLWVFGDTLFPTPSVDGGHLRTNSWAWSSPAQPADLDTPVDANGTPTQVVPFDDLEAAYNDLSGRSDDRVALWPASVLGQEDGSALVFFREVLVAPGQLHFRVLGTGIATVRPGAQVGARDGNLLFNSPEPAFSSGAVRRNGFVYLYGCHRVDRQGFGCDVARVPDADTRDRAAYEFWDGAAWSPDVRRAAVALEGPSGGPSVSWNPWLGSYLAVYSQPISNRVLMRTAPQPEGPWSSPVLAFTGETPSGQTADYAAFEHPELATDDGRTVVVTYFHPLGPFRGEIRMVRVTLA
jgi:hypothetical protein